jgi:sec-independent protein translocase protein TatC
MAELTRSPSDQQLTPPALSGEVTPEVAPDRVMTLTEHLVELRRRLLISLATVAVGTVVGFVLSPEAIRILAEPIPGPLFFTQPAGAFLLQFKVALMIGAALGFPVLLYQFWAFISPGLTPRERRLALPWIPIALVLLVAGIGLAYTVLPVAAAFLLGFQIEGVVQPLITADAYFGFVTTMFIAFALVMQLPIFVMLLTKAGLVSVARLRRSRRYVLLGIVVLAVVVTPADPVSTVLLTVVMYPLFELTIQLAARSQPAAPTDG